MEMERLDYRLPERTRVQWASGKIRATWEPRLAATVNALADMEVRSVALDQRKACILPVYPDDFPAKASELLAMGLGVMPLHIAGADAAISVNAPTNGGPWTYMVLAYRELVEGDLASDRRLGELLGYPPCCIDSFCQTWTTEGYIDTTWPMAAETPSAMIVAPRALEVDPLPHCNTLGRWYGLKPVPHLPCSFRCEATRDKGEQWSEFGRRLGYGAEMDILEQMTSWPVEWSALHGYAEIKTPVMRVMATTDATAEKYTVRVKGTQYPADGATGLSFPWKRQTGNVQSRGRAFRSLNTPEVRDKWYYADNQFANYKAQEQCHRALLDAIKECAALVSPKPLSVCDLGCGNGALLLEATEENEGGLIVHGCDADAAKISHARILHKGTGTWVVADIADYPLGVYDLILHMPGHVDASHCASLARHARYVALYCYPDWDPDKTMVEVPGMNLHRTFRDDGATVHLWKTRP